MTEKTVNINLNIDEKTLNDAETILNENGIELSTFLNLCLKQLASKGIALIDEIVNIDYMNTFPSGNFITDEVMAIAKLKKKRMFEKYGGLAYPVGFLEGKVWISDDFEQSLDDEFEGFEEKYIG